MTFAIVCPWASPPTSVRRIIMSKVPLSISLWVSPFLRMCLPSNFYWRGYYTTRTSMGSPAGIFVLEFDPESAAESVALRRGLLDLRQFLAEQMMLHLSIRDVLRLAFKDRIQARNDHERQKCGCDQAADHNNGERPLNLRARPAREQERHKAERGDRG